MPSFVNVLVLLVMLAIIGALCIRVAGTMRRRNARHPTRYACAAAGDGTTMDAGWTTSTCSGDSSSSSWTGGGGECGGAGASGGWESGGSDGGGSDGGGDGGGGGGD